MGTLERLQKAVLEYLRSLSDLKYASIYAEGGNNPARAEKACGLQVEILSPLPKAASKFAAGPTFSEVEISLEVCRQNEIARSAPSITTTAEIISRALHNWIPPIECGYGKVSLAAESPWERKGKESVAIKFNVQSALL